MSDLNKIPEGIYGSYKKAMNTIAKNKEELERLEKRGQPKNAHNMKDTGFGPNINWIDAHRRHLHLINDKIAEDLNNKLELYYSTNNIPKEKKADFDRGLAERYENEKVKDLDQSQEQSLQKLIKSQSKDEGLESLSSKGNDLEQSQENAFVLLEMRKEEHSKEAETAVPSKDGSGYYNYTMELSFNKMEQNLEEKVREENEHDMDRDLDRD